MFDSELWRELQEDARACLESERAMGLADDEAAPELTSEAELVTYLSDQINLQCRPWTGDSDPETWAGEPCQLAVYTERPATLAHVEALLGYLWRGPMRGEWCDGCGVERVAGHLFIFDLDTTKSQRDDVPDAWDAHRAWLTEGTPVRTTDRAGAGTKGTRAHAGLGPVLLAWR